MSLPYLQPYFGLGNSLQTAQASGAGATVGGWVELARTTLGSASDTIDVSSLPDKRYYMILRDLQNTGGTIDHYIRMGNSTIDTGSNYAQRLSQNGGSEYTGTSNSDFIDFYTRGSFPIFSMGYLANLSGKEKLYQGHMVEQNTAGSANAPDRHELVGKWVNTSNPMDIHRAWNQSGSGSYNIGSEVVVLGWDESDTHTTNFWEEIGSADLSGGSADDLDITTGLDKKYLWVQLYIEPSGTVDIDMTFNNDTTSYARRQSFNGAGDSTNINQSNVQLSNNVTVPQFMNMFIINNSSNEKLGIMHQIRQGTAGAGNAPDRYEMVFKYDETASQISRIDINNTESGSFGTNSIIKVFGSD